MTFWIIRSMPGANEWERKREGGRGEGGGEERWGRVEVKGKGVKGKTAATCSFPLRSAWWLQALDFHEASPCCTSSCHCKVCENSAHREKTAWKG